MTLKGGDHYVYFHLSKPNGLPPIQQNTFLLIHHFAYRNHKSGACGDFVKCPMVPASRCKQSWLLMGRAIHQRELFRFVGKTVLFAKINMLRHHLLESQVLQKARFSYFDKYFVSGYFHAVFTIFFSKIVFCDLSRGKVAFGFWPLVGSF